MLSLPILDEDGVEIGLNIFIHEDDVEMIQQTLRFWNHYFNCDQIQGFIRQTQTLAAMWRCLVHLYPAIDTEENRQSTIDIFYKGLFHGVQGG